MAEGHFDGADAAAENQVGERFGHGESRHRGRVAEALKVRWGVSERIFKGSAFGESIEAGHTIWAGAVKTRLTRVSDAFDRLFSDSSGCATDVEV